MMQEKNNQLIKRSYIIAVVVLGIVLAFSIISAANAKTAPEKKAYKKYCKRLNHKIKVNYVNGYDYSSIKRDGDRLYWDPNWKAKKKKISLKQFKYYKYIKLTNENKYDLMLSNSNDAMGDGHVLICRYFKGKVKPIFCVYGLRAGIYRARGKQLVFYFGGSSTGHMVFTKVNGSKLDHSSVYSCTRVKTTDPYYNVYNKGSEVIPESDYDSVSSSIGKPLKFKKIKKKIKKISRKAYKFLKGIWVTVGQSQGSKRIFTRKYMKEYSLWTKDYNVLSPKSKGKYVGKARIIYAKKKGNRWVIKVRQYGSYTYYKSRGRNLLVCWWKENGEWMNSVSSSLQRYK